VGFRLDGISGPLNAAKGRKSSLSPLIKVFALAVSSIERASPHEGQRKTGVHCVTIADAGEWNDFSLGCIIFVGS